MLELPELELSPGEGKQLPGSWESEEPGVVPGDAPDDVASLGDVLLPGVAPGVVESLGVAPGVVESLGVDMPLPDDTPGDVESLGDAPEDVLGAALSLDVPELELPELEPAVPDVPEVWQNTGPAVNAINIPNAKKMIRFFFIFLPP
jgi:hypothetical protein